MLRRMLFLAALLPAMAHAQTTDKVLQRIRDTKKVTIAYRTDAKPFSFEDGGQPAGYTVDLCKRIVVSLEQQLKVQPLTVKWVPATVQTRLDPAPLLRLIVVGLVLLALAAGAGAVVARRSRTRGAR